MIFDRLEHLETYLGIDGHLDRAIRAIMAGDYRQWECGRHEIDGNALFCNVVDIAYHEDSPWERHEAYLDIHVSLEGDEAIRVADLGDVQGWEPFNAEGDCALAPHSDAGIELPLQRGAFLIVFPQDAHMPGLGTEGSRGRKAIFKVRWER